MTSRKTLSRRTPGTPPPRRPGGALLVSLVIHGALAVVFIWVLTLPVDFDAMFRPAVDQVAAERVTYIAARPDGDGRAEGGGRPTPEPEPDATPEQPPTPSVEAPRPQAPMVIPDGVRTPVAPAPGQEAGAGGAGTGDGTGRGNARGDGMGGLVPSFSDPRVWTRSEPRPGMPRSTVQRIDSMIVADFGPLRDSAAAEALRRRPGDWTFEKDGQKYGIDEKFIRLGKFSLPTAVLGLLPLNQQANPIAMAENRRMSGVRQELEEQALRRRNDTDFKDVVKSIRERKDRERAARRAAIAAAAAEAPPGG